jgi:thiol-disulfide isomerase/thioredoxin
LGSKVNLSQFRGHAVLLWFVTTWCSSCQDGAQLLSQQYYSALHSKGVVVLTVELYNNLGQPGPSLNQFANTYGSGSKSDWLYGTAPQWVTYRYDPNGDLDIYYLINSQGNIIDTNVGLPNYLGNVVAES